MLNYPHPTLIIDQPAPGHYAIRGLPQTSIFIEGEGTVVAPQICYISPAVPDDLLEAILRDREDRREHGEESAPKKGAATPRARKRGRPSKKTPGPIPPATDEVTS